MNIFVLDIDPRTAARYHNDRHCVKMILETAQLLCTAHVILDGEQYARKQLRNLVLRPTHVNHPCAKWVREACLNYKWLHELGLCLIGEYRARYQKEHAYVELMDALSKMPLNLEHLAMRTPFPQCMPDAYKRGSSAEEAVEAYRDYYCYEKQHIATWKAPATVPTWWLTRAAAYRKKGAA